MLRSKKQASSVFRLWQTLALMVATAPFTIAAAVHPYMSELMPNIATVLKAEISRVARKDVREQSSQLKKASSQYRSDIAALKRRVLALEKQINRLAKPGKRASSETAEDTPGVMRFSAKGFAAQRRRLGLTAAATARLLNVSAQSIYKWEDGKARPRASQFPAIAGMRKMGKHDAAEILSGLAR